MVMILDVVLHGTLSHRTCILNTRGFPISSKVWIRSSTLNGLGGGFRMSIESSSHCITPKKVFPSKSTFFPFVLR